MQKERKKLSIKEQIKKIEDSGITFHTMNKETAFKFLENHTYYFKLKAYAKLFDKYTNPKHPKYGKYINLDFNQLVIFSEIDMKFRQFLLSFTLDIEHSLRVELNRTISEDVKDDGYIKTKEFLKTNFKISEKIKNISQHAQANPYTYSMISKYQSNIAAWNLLEILTFGDLLYFYEFYNKDIPEKQSLISILRYVKFVRNAAAHSNCMLNQLERKSMRIEPSKKLMSMLRGKISLSSDRKKHYMKIPVLHDFTACVITFLEVEKSENAFKRAKYALDDFLRFTDKHRSLFSYQLNIVHGFDFLQDVSKILSRTLEKKQKMNDTYNEDQKS